MSWLKSPSKSPFDALVLFVSKKGGQLRMYIDWVTVKNNVKVNDLLNWLADATRFHRIHLKSAYYQLRVANDDVHKTTIWTRTSS